MVTQSVPQCWVETPCRRSATLSRVAGCNIFLKLDNAQPSGSFKSRGIGALMSHSMAISPPNTPIHFYCSSGGNAGLACATAAITLCRPATIVVPLTTSPAMIERLRNLGAEVIQKGKHWGEADQFMREELLAKDANGVYVPPFDHPEIWRGNSSIVDEIEEQMIPNGGYDALVCSVGGGGLLNGIIEGLERHSRLSLNEPNGYTNGATNGHTNGHGHSNGYTNGITKPEPKILAMETRGYHSLHHALTSLSHIPLPPTNPSIATSLGCLHVSARSFHLATTHPSLITSHVLPDAEAAMACVRFADDEKMLIEAACGVSIAPVYNGDLRSVLYGDLGEEEFIRLNVVIVVCGGSAVGLDLLEEWRRTYGEDEEVMRRFEGRGRDVNGERTGVLN